MAEVITFPEANKLHGVKRVRSRVRESWGGSHNSNPFIFTIGSNLESKLGEVIMHIEIRDNDIRIQTDKETAASLGARYIKGNTYQLPKNIHVLRDLYKITRNEELLQLGKKMHIKQTALLIAKNDAEDVKIAEIPELRPYQAVDVTFLSLLPHAGIFNEQRTGKTPTLLSLMKLKDFKRIALVVPAGLKLNWEKECSVWLPGIKTTVIKGPKKQRERAYQSLSEQESFVIIVSYDTLKSKGELDLIITHIGTFDALAVDEAHNIRNRKSQRTEAVKVLGKQAKHRYALTGTPSVRAGYDVWSILNFLYPEKFGSYWGFLERYFVMKKDWFSGTMQPTDKYSRKEELEDILALISTNRKRKDIMSWLPDKTYQTIPIELTPKQRKAYDKVLEEFQYVEDGELKVDASSVLAQVTRLRQICLAPSMLGIKAPSAKEQFLLEWLQDNQEPVIIFSQFTSYLEELYKRITFDLKERTVMIHGRMSGEEKQKSVKLFQQGTSRILLANIKAAGVGFTLDKATTTIFLDKEWNPADNLQAEDRMVPVSKERVHKMNVISLVASDTYDEKIDMLLKSKYSITEVINSGGLKAIDRLYKELKGNGQNNH